MMSSVIPARLEFQCGHAALVSLPRVKGESPTQRNDRVAREKSAAQARSCDFCPPRMEVVELAQAVVIVAAQPATTPPPAVTQLAPAVTQPTPAVTLPQPAVTLPQPAVALAVANEVTPPVAPATDVPSVPAVAAPRDATTSTTRRVGRPRRTPAPAAQTARLTRNRRDTVHTDHANGQNGHADAKTAGSARNGRATGFRFVVRFRTEAVLSATDIHDALRQAESLGATEVLALARTT